MSEPSALRKGLALAGIIISGLYLINPGWGVFEIVPDNIPGVGNLDEATAVALFLWALAVLRGKPVTFGGGAVEKQAVEVDPPETAAPDSDTK